MMMTVAPVVSIHKNWLACLGLQVVAGLLALACFKPTSLTLGIDITLGSILILVGLLNSIRPWRVSIHNLLHPFKKGLVISWFLVSLLSVTLHPALLIFSLFSIVQFQRFTPQFKPSHVAWMLGSAGVLIAGAVSWYLTQSPPITKMMAYGTHIIALWMSSFLPLLGWYSLTQVQTRTLLEAQQGALMQQSTLALTDALTGLGNRRYFDETLSREMARTKRNASPLSLVLLDIDFFKKINDVYGHTTGDAVLKELASLMATNLRQCDWIARYGGEEYALILPDTPCLEALKLLERLRLLVEKQVFAREHSPMKITVSMGITQYDVKRHTLESLIEEADEALYEAKNHGRNQVRVYGLGASGDTLVSPQALIEARHASLYSVG